MNLRSDLRPGWLAIIIGLTLLLPTRSAQADIVYHLLPQSPLDGPGSQLFHLAGGTITTDGTIGPGFSKDNIIDYEINITGTFDFTFRPFNAGARVFTVDPELIVTEDEIYFEALPQGDYAELRFESRVRLDPFATIHVQQVAWGQGSSPVQISRTSFISQSFGGGVNQPSNGQGNLTVPMLNKFVIARSANFIPEPGTAGFLIVLSVGLLGQRRRS